ncbi:MAG TPA: cytochrome C oxidase subunit II [Thermomicrobiales bacterium]|jgi:cytochrome c oxidase subunit 2|nr:cytochrome C oxidase subunit II [Chloroflexota bacterium]HBY45221.1 cytochrome C oxidase subunit II [Chloroflexota bacterium]HCG28364.1 cytochrome C oxidase subunit II [Chloroflexota bacterium]HQZ88976.1 cytochrome C oxidase subunit II [Thermomicrobiales bacterium]HRA31906.1 cytochrome C oxidase subunit II [Thermomicrobiales bacterium]
MANRFSTFAKPQGVWWTAMGRDEKLWLGIAAIWGVSMFAMISFIWPMIGSQQNNILSYRIEPTAYKAHVDAYVTAHTVGEVEGVPIVAPEPGGEVYLEAYTYAWRPVIQLKRGETYTFYISSLDMQHGFSLVMPGHALNLQILPGFVTEIKLTPQESGTFPIICNEYCGPLHHMMTGQIIVTD